MELTLILGAVAVVGAIAMLWWGITARPSAARGNLLAGLPEAGPAQSPLAFGSDSFRGASNPVKTSLRCGGSSG